MTTLQTADIDDDGTQIAYIDSGPPSEDAYTTLVIVHGHTYHARNFSRLLPIARNYNLRVIALNRRDYIGSTPFSADELAIIHGHDDAAHTAFLQARGLEIARFLAWVIKEKKIPHASEDGKEGGLALLGWSLGNMFTMAFLRHVKSYPKEIVETIEPYLKALYIYESGSGTLGYQAPPIGYHPLNDPSIPARMRGIVFGTWVSSYYKHPYFSSGRKLERVPSSLQIRTPEKDQVYRPATFDTFTPQEFLNCIDSGPPARSEQPFMGGLNRMILYDQTQGVFLLDYMRPSEANSLTSKVQHDDGDTILPDVKIRIVYGDASVWSATWLAWVLEKDLDKWKEEGRNVRSSRFILVEGGNHFLHWDKPDKFLRAVRDGLES